MIFLKKIFSFYAIHLVMIILSATKNNDTIQTLTHIYHFHSVSIVSGDMSQIILMPVSYLMVSWVFVIFMKASIGY